MIKTSLLLKWSLALFLGLGAVTTMAYYKQNESAVSIFEYPKTIYESYFKRPKAPEIVDQKVEGNCGARIWFYDNATNEDHIFLQRRVLGEAAFVTIQIRGPHAGGPGSFDNGNLPIGSYEYRVGVSNEYGNKYSNISETIVIDEEVCGTDPLLIKPLNPIIVSLDRIGEDKCSIRITYEDNSLDEDGVRIYRWSWVDDTAMIAELPPNNGPTGSYDDLNLVPGHYQYQVSVFNANGESFSNVSDEFYIQDASCDSSTSPLLPAPTLDPVVSIAPEAEPKACIWKAAVNVFVRTGPGASRYPEITAVEAGTEFPVIGQSEDEQFWAVELEPGVVGYVPKADKFGLTSGDCKVPILSDPTAPESSSPQQPEDNNNNNVAAQCNDGVDNDRDGAVDMRDRDCRSPEDNSE